MAKKKVMALGFFDGIHIGHAALMNMIIKRAREYDAEPAVLTFDVHPDSLVFKKNVPLINSADDRERILSRCFGIDDVVVVHFSQSVMHMDLSAVLSKAERSKKRTNTSADRTRSLMSCEADITSVRKWAPRRSICAFPTGSSYLAPAYMPQKPMLTARNICRSRMSEFARP